VSKIVVDASAVMAALEKSPGTELLVGQLGRAVMSAVNFGELLSHLSATGGNLDHIITDLQTLLPNIRPFDSEQALVLGYLEPLTRGLSLGERVCLALGKRLDLPVLTTNSEWLKLDIGVKVEVIGGILSEKVA
jgi:ribonuclease VapC